MPKENQVANDNASFRLYRVYDLDMILGTYMVRVYIKDELFNQFNLVSVSFDAERK
jgi:fibronectin type 3 domain-containing protein